MKRAVTLVEMIIAVAIVGLVGFGIISAEQALRKHNQSSLQNTTASINAKTILSHVVNKVNQAVGSPSDPGLLIGTPTSLCVRTDISPTWACYTVIAKSLYRCDLNAPAPCPNNPSNLLGESGTLESFSPSYDAPTNIFKIDIDVLDAGSPNFYHETANVSPAAINNQVSVPCVPNCTGKICGDDGCSGTCGACVTGTACNSAGNVCEPILPTCSDGVQNQSEENVDCGGPCSPCGGGTESCTDGIQNQDEIGVDCGGVVCLPCENTDPDACDGHEGEINICGDGNPCTNNHKCLAGGGCSPGLPVACDDGDACTADTCDPDAGGCVSTAIVCPDDGDVCNGGEYCDAALGCAHGGRTCDDANPCTADSCNSLTGCEYAPIANCMDCNGVVGGTAVLDCAGDCNGGAVLDCAGTCNGSAAPDCAGVCNGGAVVDCAGDCNGGAVLDCAGACNGSAAPDCAGVCNGGAVLDCAGDCNGSAVVDCAGDCNGSATLDCAGDCNGTAVVDCAGDCNGSAVVDCNGDCGGSATVDACGVCGGDGSSC
jgi:hypothetical protein